MMDTSMAPAAATIDRQLTTQQVSHAMAGPVAAAAGRSTHSLKATSAAVAGGTSLAPQLVT